MSRPEKGILKEGPPSVNDDGRMAELRSLLLVPTEQQLNELHARLFDPHRQLEEVSQVLPEAITVRAQEDNDLSVALAPAVPDALARSVRSNPQPAAEAIWPIMGPALRKAFSWKLKQLALSINRTISLSLTPRGWRWGWEAFTTGRSFTEVRLSHTLLFRVEEVFLLDMESGRLLGHVSSGLGGESLDTVSGSLVAIQDLMRNSESNWPANQLERFQVGEVSVWMEAGPRAILAAVIRGSAPQELRELFRRTLNSIHLRYAPALEQPENNREQLGEIEGRLAECLQVAYQPETGWSQSRLTPLRVITIVAVFALLIWGFFWLRERQHWNAYLERLKSEPGIVVTDVRKEGGKYIVSGLRDPLARDPNNLIRETKLEPASVVHQWQPFQALTSDFVLARAIRSLTPPKTLKLQFKDGVLYAEGFASHDWIQETRRLVRLLPGINQFSEEKLLDLQRIDSAIVLFEPNDAIMRSNQDERLDQLLRDLKQLQQLAGPRKVALVITGRTDGSWAETRNINLAQRRAETVADWLKANLSTNLSATSYTYITLDSKEGLREMSDEQRARNRSVTLKVVVDENS